MDPDGFNPRYIVHKAVGVGGPPIPEGEPVLVIRAQDRLALPLLEHYIRLYETLAADYDPQVVADLTDHLNALMQWQFHHPTKWADR